MYYEAQRKGKGPWLLWFPKNTQKYLSRPIKTKSELQALGSWLASDSEGRSWHNTVFKDYKEIFYRGRKYTKDQGKLLYKTIVENDDWDGVDLGDPVSEEKSKLKLRSTKNENIILNILNDFCKIGMAKPRDIDFNKTYYHGTDSESAAKSIMNEGKKSPDLELAPKRKLTPVIGKVYLTPDLKYGVIYALGANMIGQDLSDSLVSKNRFGYLFVVSGKEIKDIQPDEDSIGEILFDLFSEREQIESKVDLSKLQWLKRLAENNLTPLQLKKVKRYDDFGDLVVASKKLLKYMTDDEKLKLIDAGAHVAHTGGITVEKVWRIDKKKSKELNKDGSNFFEIAERVK